jgi:hypothetical protein
MQDYINPRQIALIEQSDREARIHLSSGSILVLNSDNESIENAVQTLMTAANGNEAFISLPAVRVVRFILPRATPQQS